MSVNTVPRFIEQPHLWKVAVSAANANVDGTGTLSTLMTGASPHGSKVDYLLFQAASVVQANILRIFVFTAAATAHLWKEISISATSGPKVDGQMWASSYTPATPLIVPSGWTVRVSVHSANTVNVFGIGGDY